MQTIVRPAYFIAIVLAIAALAFLLIRSAVPAETQANPPLFLVATSTASATSTLIYQTPGTATTTLIYDAYANGGSGEVNGVMSFLMAVQYTASSTTSKLGMSIERAHNNGTDCISTPTACDWYHDNTDLYFNSTTTPAKDITTANSMSWTFASSSQGAAAVAAANNRDMKYVNVPILSRYTRINFYQSGTTNGAVYAEAYAVKQR